MSRQRPKLANALYIAYTAAALMALIWPGPLLIGQLRAPLLAGLPPLFAWTVAWVILSFIALVSYHLTRRGMD